MIKKSVKCANSCKFLCNHFETCHNCIKKFYSGYENILFPAFESKNQMMKMSKNLSEKNEK